MSLGLSFRLYLDFPGRAALVLGILQAVLGILSIVLAVAGFVQKIWGDYLGTGIWCGVAVFIDGLCGVIGAQTRTSCPVKTFFLVSIVSAILTFIMVVLSAGGLDYRSNFYYDAYYYAYYRDQPTKALHAALLSLGIIQCFLSIINALLCIKPTCQKKPAVKYKTPKNFSSPIVRSRPVENTDIPRGVVGGDPSVVHPMLNPPLRGRYQSPRRPRHSYPFEQPTETSEFLPQQYHRDISDPDLGCASTDRAPRQQKRRSRGSDSDGYPERTDEPAYSGSRRRDHQGGESPKRHGDRPTRESSSVIPERHTSSLHRDKQDRPRVRGRNSLETDRVRIRDVESGILRSRRDRPHDYDPNTRDSFRNHDSWPQRSPTEKPRPGRARRENYLRENSEQKSPDREQNRTKTEVPRPDLRSDKPDQCPVIRGAESRAEPLRRSIGARGSYSAAVNLMPAESADCLLDNPTDENEQRPVQAGRNDEHYSYVPPMVFGEEELPPYEETAGGNQSPIYCTVGSFVASASEFPRDHNSGDNSRLAEHGTSTAESSISQSVASRADEEVQEIMGTRHQFIPNSHNILSNDTEQCDANFCDDQISSHASLPGQPADIPFIDDTHEKVHPGHDRNSVQVGQNPPFEVSPTRSNPAIQSSRPLQERPSNVRNVVDDHQRSRQKTQEPLSRAPHKKRSKPVRTDSFTQTTPPISVNPGSKQREELSKPVVSVVSPQNLIYVVGRQSDTGKNSLTFKASEFDQSDMSDRKQIKPFESSESSYALPKPNQSSPAYFRRAEYEQSSDILPSLELEDIPDIGRHVHNSFRASFPQHFGKLKQKRGQPRSGLPKVAGGVEKQVSSSTGSVTASKDAAVINTYSEELSSSFPLLGAVGGVDFGISDQESYLYSPVSTPYSFSLEELKPRHFTSSPYRHDQTGGTTGSSGQHLTGSEAEPEIRDRVIETVNVGVASPTRHRPKQKWEINTPTAYKHDKPTTSSQRVPYVHENQPESSARNGDQKDVWGTVEKQPVSLPPPPISTVVGLPATASKYQVSPKSLVTLPKFFYPPERLPSRVLVDSKQPRPRYPSLDRSKDKPIDTEPKVEMVEVPSVPALPFASYRQPQHDHPGVKEVRPEGKTNVETRTPGLVQTQPPFEGNSRPGDASASFLAIYNTDFNRTGWIRQTYPAATIASHPSRSGQPGASHQLYGQKPIGRAAMRQIMRSEQAAQEEPLHLQTVLPGGKPTDAAFAHRYVPRRRLAVPATADSLAPTSGGPPPYSEAPPRNLPGQSAQRNIAQQQHAAPPHNGDNRSRRQPIFSSVL